MKKLLVSSVLLTVLLFIAGVVQAQDISEEARRYMARGIGAVDMAKSPSDYELAAAEFEQAAKLAPSWPAPHFNLGKVLAAAGKPEQAIQHYKRYLELSPQGPDSTNVRSEIYKLEYRVERMEKMFNLSGTWQILYEGAPQGRIATIRVESDGRITIAWYYVDSTGSTYLIRITGRVEGNVITGEMNRESYTDLRSQCLIPMYRSLAKGKILAEEHEIKLTFRDTKYDMRWRKDQPPVCISVVAASEGERYVTLVRPKQGR
jgi:tetratricopeptide (TPR) repeat protein